jgi:TM2 domain-containing membrane protein YozV
VTIESKIRINIFDLTIFMNDLKNKRKRNKIMAGQGSGGNVIAALCSFFIPGLGQLLQGRLLLAIVQFVLAGALWVIWMGWIIHLWSILSAAMFKPKH